MATSLKVLILTNTKMTGNKVCIGGLTLNGKNSQYIRLFNRRRGEYFTTDAKIVPFSICNIKFDPLYDRLIKRPHVEDVIVHQYQITPDIFTYVPQNFIDRINQLIGCYLPYYSFFEDVFEGSLSFTPKGKGYLSLEKKDLEGSVCFWMIDRPLTCIDMGGKVCYQFSAYGRNILIPYVGLDKPIVQISPGTVVRLSLARWWIPKNEDVEERCYLQLSHIYMGNTP